MNSNKCGALELKYQPSSRRMTCDYLLLKNVRAPSIYGIEPEGTNNKNQCRNLFRVVASIFFLASHEGFSSMPLRLVLSHGSKVLFQLPFDTPSVGGNPVFSLKSSMDFKYTVVQQRIWKL